MELYQPRYCVTAAFQWLRQWVLEFEMCAGEVFFTSTEVLRWGLNSCLCRQVLWNLCTSCPSMAPAPSRLLCTAMPKIDCHHTRSRSNQVCRLCDQIVVCFCGRLAEVRVLTVCLHMGLQSSNMPPPAVPHSVHPLPSLLEYRPQCVSTGKWSSA